MSIESGTDLNQYRVVAKIGEGGMGEVYRATDTRLKRDVAIKVLPAALAADVDRLARLEREAQVLAQLDHPNISSIYGLEEAGETRLLVMQLAEGRRLSDRIATGPLSAPEAMEIALNIARGLEAAHEKGVVHRDLKPDNVMIAEDGTVKILDFGLAKATEADGSRSEDTLIFDGTATVPQVSPSGLYVSFSWANSVAEWFVDVIEVATGEHHPAVIRIEVSALEHLIAWGRSRWLSDGRIAFIGQDESGNTGIYVQDFVPGTDTSATRRRLAGFIPGVITESFGIAPDGSSIVLAVRQPSRRLFMVDQVAALQ